mgnify:CR=1 FL=1
MPSFGPEAMSALQVAMRFRKAREAVIAGNVANADTPGYRRRDLAFEGILGEAQASRGDGSGSCTSTSSSIAAHSAPSPIVSVRATVLRLG